VREVTVGDKALMTAAAPDGTAEVAVAADRRQQAALTPEQATELARLGVAVEAAFGAPQDVEWAIAGGSTYLLQARPVTAIARAPVHGSLDGPVPGDDAWPALGERPPQPYDLWTQSDMGERWPEPVTPLIWSIQPQLSLDYTLYSFRDVKAPYLRQTQWAKRFFGRVYLNEGALSRVCLEEYGIPLSMVSGAMGGWASEEQAGGRRLRMGRLLRALPAMLPVLLDRMRNEKRYPALFPRIDRSVRAFRRRDLSQASDRALWDELHDVWLARVARAINLHGDVTSSSMMALPMLERLVERWYGRKEAAHELLTGIADLRQAEMVPALYAMAQQLRGLGLASVVLDQPPAEALARLRATPEARPFLQALDRFLDDHGHRCAIEAEFLYPRWAEAPEQVLDALAAYLRAPEVNPLAAEARQRERRAATLAAVERHFDPARRAIFRRILARTEHLVRLRDNGQHYLVKLMLPLRHLFAVLGERWAARGWLAQPSDVFFLAIAEVEALAKAGNLAAADRDLRATVAARRQAYDHWFTVKAPEVVDAQGRPVATETEDEGALRGIAASGGRAEGRARVIQRLEDAGQLQPGDVLVTRATDPGWTPIFPLVSALVLEVGGQLSHGAIVAREYGVPAVVNVHDATARIRDGQRITVDGTAGRVYLDGVATASSRQAVAVRSDE
jgi:pyruvate,water dikinase